MVTYQIKEILTECRAEELRKGDFQFVAVLTPEEWKSLADSFDMGIELEMDLEAVHTTKAEVNYDSLTGSFCIPDRERIAEESDRFLFALDEKGIVFVDKTGTVKRMVEQIMRTKHWKLPGLERFLYDFLEQIVHSDQSILEKYELELDEIEEILSSDEKKAVKALDRVNEIRCDLRELRMHYEQLLDLSQELEENENNFFKAENLRYFRLYSARIERLRDISSFVRDYTLQLRELYESQLSMKQNRIMTLLTVITSIFMPLTLITGWYGMNFKYMPELEAEWAYPLVFGVSVTIVAVSLLFFKKKKWL